jgi:hypothetical protein
LKCKITRRTNKETFSVIPYCNFFYFTFFTGRTKTTGIKLILSSHLVTSEKERKVRKEQEKGVNLSSCPLGFQPPLLYS